MNQFKVLGFAGEGEWGRISALNLFDRPHRCGRRIWSRSQVPAQGEPGGLARYRPCDRPAASLLTYPPFFSARDDWWQLRSSRMTKVRL